MEEKSVTEFAKEIILLKDSLSYQENAIVSKTLITKKEESITLFSFDEGQEINTHTAPVEAIVLVLEGKVEIIISDEKFNLKDGELIIIPANEPHSLIAKTKFKMMLIKL